MALLGSLTNGPAMQQTAQSRSPAEQPHLRGRLHTAAPLPCAARTACAWHREQPAKARDPALHPAAPGAGASSVARSLAPPPTVRGRQGRSEAAAWYHRICCEKRMGRHVRLRQSPLRSASHLWDAPTHLLLLRQQARRDAVECDADAGLAPTCCHPCVVVIR